MNPDPLATNEKPMTFKDAAIVATILMLSTTLVVYMPIHGYDAFISDPGRFAYEILVFVAGQWITLFVSLTGLARYVKSKQNTGG